MPLLRSLAYGLKEARFNPLTVMHSLCYAATVTYLRVLKHLAQAGPESVRAHIAETYHGKVVRLDDAGRIITVNRNIEMRNLEQVLPYRHATSIILKNPHNIAVYECPCRGVQKNPCTPTEVCLVVGEPFADLVRMFQPFRSRRISPEDALRILREEDDRGHVHTAWFKSAMLDRFYAICNCCSCCCLGMQFMARYNMKMLLPSGYRAVVGDGCAGCGSCVRFCQFHALEMVPFPDNGSKGKRCRVDRDKCFGCGVCESKCRRSAISLIPAPETGMPLNIEALAGQGTAGGD